MRTVVVFGPQGCGKTRNAERLMMAYGCSRVQEEWDGLAPLPPGTLALTNLAPPYGVDVDEAVSFGVAKTAAA